MCCFGDGGEKRETSSARSVWPCCLRTATFPTELTSLTALMAGHSSPTDRMRLGRLQHGTYDVSLFADGEPILKDVVHIGKDDTEVVVSLIDDE